MFVQWFSNLAFLMIAIGLFSQSVWAKSDERIYWIAADEVVWDYAPSFPVDPMQDN